MLDQKAAQKGDIFTVETILDRRTRKNRTEYLLKWAGWDHSFNTWEPSQNIYDKSLVKSFLEERARKKKSISPSRRRPVIPVCSQNTVDIYEFEPDQPRSEDEQHSRPSEQANSEKSVCNEHQVTPIKLKIRFGKDEAEERELPRSSPTNRVTVLSIGSAESTPSKQSRKKRKKRNSEDNIGKHYKHQSKRPRKSLQDSISVHDTCSDSKIPSTPKLYSNLTESTPSPTSLPNNAQCMSSLLRSQAALPPDDYEPNSTSFHVDTVINNVTLIEVKAFNENNVIILEFDSEESFFRAGYCEPQQQHSITVPSSVSAPTIKQERIDVNDFPSELEPGDPVVQAAYSGSSLPSAEQGFVTAELSVNNSPIKNCLTHTNTTTSTEENSPYKRQSEDNCDDDESYIDVVNVPSRPEKTFPSSQSEYAVVPLESRDINVIFSTPSTHILPINNSAPVASLPSTHNIFNAFSTNLWLPFMAMQAASTTASILYPSFIPFAQQASTLSAPIRNMLSTDQFYQGQQPVKFNSEPTSYSLTTPVPAVSVFKEAPIQLPEDYPLDLTTHRQRIS